MHTVDRIEIIVHERKSNVSRVQMIIIILALAHRIHYIIRVDIAVLGIHRTKQIIKW